ncbi:hypothetical protein ACJX0J_013067, partial [Zea mays]
IIKYILTHINIKISIKENKYTLNMNMISASTCIVHIVRIVTCMYTAQEQPQECRPNQAQLSECSEWEKENITHNTITRTITISMIDLLCDDTCMHMYIYLYFVFLFFKFKSKSKCIIIFK